MISTAELNGKLAIDANSLNNLKQAAQENSPEAIRGVAKQFEAIFMNMMLKSMRDATPQEDPFSSDQSRTYTSMLDQQLSSNLTNKGMGLAEILTRQLTKVGGAVTLSLAQAVSSDAPEAQEAPLQNDFIPSILKSTPYHGPAEQTKIPANKTTNLSPLSESSASFRDRMTKHAELASKATGVPAHLMLGQAALESGWGKREIKAQDGTTSHNLFGIKATGDWNGKVVETTTTEYIRGIKQKRVEKFRAYDSYADSFKDFANLMRNNPRYKNVVANMSDVNNYALAMQNAGYATDPHYASKLANVIHKVTT
ncbi:MAG: flagellar assembly peptidoglycan hydrolase FlgJ [Methylophilaceae bacterium]